MPTPAYTALASYTLSSATTTINLTNLPTTYKDLIIAITWYNSGNASAVRIRLNDSTGSHDWATIFSNTTPTAGGGNSDETSMRAFGVAQGPTTNWQTGLITLFNYRDATRNKYVLTRHADASGDNAWVGGRWEDNSPVTKVTIFDVLNQTIQPGAKIEVWGRI